MSHQPVAQYTWDELATRLGLPTATDLARPGSPGAGVPTTGTSIPELLVRKCADGERTHHLTKLAGALFAKGFSLRETTGMCSIWNAANHEPLDEDKVVETVESIQRTDRRNHPERFAHLIDSTPLFDLSAGRIDRYLTTNPPRRRWLIKDLLVLGKAAAVIAPGGSSKSQWLLQLAVGVASGVPVADQWEIGERGSALVFFAEDDNDEIHRRIKRITDHLKLEGHGAALQGIEDRLRIFSTIGVDTLLTRRESSGEVTRTGITERILKMAEQLTDLRLIVFDPASRFRGGEENSNEDATRFVEALETLAKQTGATVMIAHHTNKTSYIPDYEPGQGASRGASALTDGLRWQMNLGRLSAEQLKSIGVPKEHGGRYVAATVTKTNYSSIPAPVLLERLDDGYLSAVSPTQAQQRAQTQAILAILKLLAAQPKPISARRLEDHFGGLSGPLKRSKPDVRELLKVAVQRGLLSGGERKPLTITALGALMLQSGVAQTEDASGQLKTRPPEKSQSNQ